MSAGVKKGCSSTPMSVNSDRGLYSCTSGTELCPERPRALRLRRSRHPHSDGSAQMSVLRPYDVKRNALANQGETVLLECRDVPRFTNGTFEELLYRPRFQYAIRNCGVE